VLVVQRGHGFVALLGQRLRQAAQRLGGGVVLQPAQGFALQAFGEPQRQVACALALALLQRGHPAVQFHPVRLAQGVQRIQLGLKLVDTGELQVKGACGA